MTDEELDLIRANEAMATPGPWEANARDCDGGMDSHAYCGLGWEVSGPPEADLRGQFARGQDAIFIAASRSDIPALLAALDAARAREQKLRDVLRRGREALLPGWLDNCLSIKEQEFLLAVDALLTETEARMDDERADHRYLKMAEMFATAMHNRAPFTDEDTLLAGIEEGLYVAYFHPEFVPAFVANHTMAFIGEPGLKAAIKSEIDMVFNRAEEGAMDEETKAAAWLKERRASVASGDLGPNAADSPTLVNLGIVLDALDRLAPMAPLLEIVERLEAQPLSWAVGIDHDKDSGSYQAERRLGWAVRGNLHCERSTLADAVAALSATLAEADGTEAG